MQMKTMTYHFKLNQLAKTKQCDDTKWWRRYGEMKTIQLENVYNDIAILDIRTIWHMIYDNI